jgi:FkbM family methyltransferase
MKNIVRSTFRRFGYDLVRFSPPAVSLPVGTAVVEPAPVIARAEHARDILIGGKAFRIESDDEYLENLGREFEPATVRLFDSLLTKADCALDVGANIGCTALALGERSRKVIAFEPAPATFAFLKRNVSNSGLKNVDVVNSALGAERGDAEIIYAASNRSGAFVSNHTSVTRDHVSEKIVIQRLDDLMPSLDIPRVDFMKLDVEGFEQSVITGAAQTISQFKPVVMLELNHWCLNALQRTSVPDFLDFLRGIFPVLLAVEGDRFANLHDNDESYMVMYRHIVHFEFAAIVGSFSADRLKTFRENYRPVRS